MPAVAAGLDSRARGQRIPKPPRRWLGDGALQLSEEADQALLIRWSLELLAHAQSHCDRAEPMESSNSSSLNSSRTRA